MGAVFLVGGVALLWNRQRAVLTLAESDGGRLGDEHVRFVAFLVLLAGLELSFVGAILLLSSTI